jgi:hypothetical protein
LPCLTGGALACCRWALPAAIDPAATTCSKRSRKHGTWGCAGAVARFVLVYMFCAVLAIATIAAAAITIAVVLVAAPRAAAATTAVVIANQHIIVTMTNWSLIYDHYLAPSTPAATSGSGWARSWPVPLSVQAGSRVQS